MANIDKLLFHAEEILIREEINKLKDNSTLRRWATENNLFDHTIVRDKLAHQDRVADESESEDELIFMEEEPPKQPPRTLMWEEKIQICEDQSLIPALFETEEKEIQITPDGNCLFRAVSFAVTNTESNHRTLREKTCDYAVSNQEKFQSFLRPGFRSVDHYLKSKKMYQDGTWATEFEILVLAHMLGCNIYTGYNKKWIKTSGRFVDINKPCLDGAIILKGPQPRDQTTSKKTSTFPTTQTIIETFVFILMIVWGIVSRRGMPAPIRDRGHRAQPTTLQQRTQQPPTTPLRRSTRQRRAPIRLNL
ncbi:hypothetical protein FSP39_008864 [Pinctada imbricata]|uniref:OTU domain-containing protein n=1 Tax=Pinctada imbricata TaxID=66713 RepID=A0AA89C0X7_PINIB|nr:hypothetical protein FSP39_008864 [Pinctada imbricata]